MPEDWQDDLDTEHARQLARTLAALQATAKQVLASALDSSVARLGRERLAAMLQEVDRDQ